MDRLQHPESRITRNVTYSRPTMPTLSLRTGTVFFFFLITVPLLGLHPAASRAVPLSPPESSLADSLKTLERHRAQRNFRTALDRLTDLKATHPDNASVLWRRALILTDLGKRADSDDQTVAYYRRALHDANAAVAADSAAWAHAVKALVEGRLCLHVGKRERARRSERLKHHAERALTLDSTLALGHHMLGRWHRRVAALNFFERQVAGAIYDDGLPDASFEQSVRHLQRALEWENKSYHHLHLARTYLRMDREKAARRLLKRALNADGSPLDPEYKAEARAVLRTLD